MPAKNTFKIEIETKDEIEVFISLFSLGIQKARSENLFDIRFAELILYSPYVMKILESLEVGEETIDLIHRGTEIEDIASLIPHAMERVIDKINTSALSIIEKKSKNIKVPVKKWIKS